MNTVPLSGVFRSDPEIVGGTPVCADPCVPVQNLLDYLEDGESILDFLAGFPTSKSNWLL